MNPYAEKWGIEAYTIDDNALIHRVYFTGSGWSEKIADMLAIKEAEVKELKTKFERQGLYLNIRKMTTNNPPPTGLSDYRRSRGYLIGQQGVL